MVGGGEDEGMEGRWIKEREDGKMKSWKNGRMEGCENARMSSVLSDLTEREGLVASQPEPHCVHEQVPVVRLAPRLGLR